MKKINFKKTLIIMILFFILFISYMELKNTLRKIKMSQQKNKTVNMMKINNSNIITNPNSKEVINSNTPENLDNKKPTLKCWKAIKRKDSYNNELQFYSKSNVIIEDNTIEITSKKETKGSKLYTSGLVESTTAYKYGYFKFNIEISKGKGLFPAIWFLPNDGSSLPEVDLFEMIGSEPHIFYGVIHFTEDDIQGSDHFKYKVPIKSQYSVALSWDPTSITWYIDDKEVYTSKKGVPNKYMYIIINQAIGGVWPGNPDNDTVFPNKFKVTSTSIKPLFKESRY
ncbi:glycoside hydrolase family 16 protein [Dethiothermospora halolimnae]|uniref:glycoside hydrolase family 16 protein n=1 Tax=Dethiothermospora halolimnae TaxID=3114390 RepID=UPI003CCB975A